MTLEQEKKPVPTQQQTVLAEKRAAALRANLKKRKEQTANRTNKEEITE